MKWCKELNCHRLKIIISELYKKTFGELNTGSKSCSAVMEVDLESDPAHTSTPPGSPLSLQLNLSISVVTKRRFRADL